jgi:hypothetical protein
MRRLITGTILCLGFALLLSFSTTGACAQDTQLPNPVQLQQQIDQLKQQLAEMEDLKARLAKIEEQLKTSLDTQKKLADAEKKTEDARAKEVREHKLGGYMVLRYRGDNATDGKKEFLIRNARAELRGDLSPRSTYRLEMQFDSKEKGGGPGSKAQLRTAYVQYRTGLYDNIRFGQFTIPWGYELEYPTADLWTGERAYFMDRLFPDQRDIGAAYTWFIKPGTTQLDMGLFNGSGINASETNQHKDPMGRVRFPFKDGSFAASFYQGASDSTASTPRTRTGIGADYKYGPMMFMGEYVAGKDLGHNVDGWYAQLGSKIGKTPGVLFAKYDTYNEDISADDHDLRRFDLGYFYDLDPRTRLTLVYEKRQVGDDFSERTKYDGNALYLQWRVKY